MQSHQLIFSKITTICFILKWDLLRSLHFSISDGIPSTERNPACKETKTSCQASGQNHGSKYVAPQTQGFWTWAHAINFIAICKVKEAASRKNSQNTLCSFVHVSWKTPREVMLVVSFKHEPMTLTCALILSFACRRRNSASPTGSLLLFTKPIMKSKLKNRSLPKPLVFKSAML